MDKNKLRELGIRLIAMADEMDGRTEKTISHYKANIHFSFPQSLRPPKVWVYYSKTMGDGWGGSWYRDLPPHSSENPGLSITLTAPRENIEELLKDKELSLLFEDRIAPNPDSFSIVTRWGIPCLASAQAIVCLLEEKAKNAGIEVKVLDWYSR